MSRQNMDYSLVGAILTDHEERIVSVPKGYFQTSEVIVQLSLMEISPYDEDALLDTNAIVEELPTMGHRFVTLRGTYLKYRDRKLAKDAQTALRTALRRCPDRQYLPLVMSVLDRDRVPGSLSGVVLDFVGDRLLSCQLDGEAYRLKEADPKLHKRFSETMRSTIQAHWDYVASLDDY